MCIRDRGFISGDLIRTFFSAYPGEGVGEKRIFPVDLKFDLIKHEYEAVEIFKSGKRSAHRKYLRGL